MVSRAAVAVSVIIRKASAILVTVWRFWDLIEFGVFVRSRLEPPDNGRAERFCEMTDALPTGSLSLLPPCMSVQRRGGAGNSLAGYPGSTPGLTMLPLSAGTPTVPRHVTTPVFG